VCLMLCNGVCIMYLLVSLYLIFCNDVYVLHLLLSGSPEVV
jgi:hypothetical protein